MNWFPQLSSGSLVQAPASRKRMWRAIANETESGERFALADATGGFVDWRLSYRDLSDTEAKALQDLFAASQGQWGSFGFVDPMANLLAWNDDFSNAAWQMGGVTASRIAGGWTLHNGTGADQTVSQSVAIPGSYTACFSVSLRSSAASKVRLVRDGAVQSVTASSAWSRGLWSGTGTSGAQSSTFGIVLAAGQSVDVSLPQVEAQPYASTARVATLQRGIYSETYFTTDELPLTATGPGLWRCDVQMRSRV